jgi:hypothetical protein
MTSRLYSLRGKKEPTSPFMDKDIREYAATKSRFYLSYIISKYLDMLVVTYVTNLLSSLKLSLSSPRCTNLE